MFRKKIKPDSPVKDFISHQKFIRVVFIDQGGFGDMAASANVMARLREPTFGFQGTYEAIYEDDSITSMSTLFGLPSNITDVYYDSKSNTRFITATEFANRREHNQNEFVTLGISGWCHTRCKKDSYNVSLFISMDNSADISDNTITYYLAKTDKKYYLDASNTYFTTDATCFNQTVDYLYHDPEGKKLFAKKPALPIVIEGIIKQKFNVLPVYGYPIHAPWPDGNTNGYAPNMLEIILGARLAQLTGSLSLHKPLLIAVYYDYTKEANWLNDLIHSKDWGSYENKGAKNARAVITKLNLDQQNQFSAANLADINAIDTIQNLKSEEILLLSMGSFPKEVFDSLYTYTHTNIWPQIREGDSSFSSLVLTGKPHIRCGGWEAGFDLIQDANLKSRLVSFYKDFCDWQFSDTSYIWKNSSESYIALSDFIIEANNPNSSFSQYFHLLKETAINNDRICFALDAGLDLLQESIGTENTAIRDHSTQIKNSLQTSSASPRAVPFFSKATSWMLSSAKQTTQFFYHKLTDNPASVTSYLNYLVDLVKPHAQSLAENSAPFVAGALCETMITNITQALFYVEAGHGNIEVTYNKTCSYKPGR